MRMRRIPHQQAQRPKATHYFVPASMDQAALPQRGRPDLLDRADQPGGAVGDDQQRRAQPAACRSRGNPRQASVELGGGAIQANQDRLAVGGDRPGAQHRLGAGPVVVAEMGAVHEHTQRVQADQRAGPPGGELALDGFADPADRRARHGRLRAERLRQAGLHVPGRQPARSRRSPAPPAHAYGSRPCPATARRMRRRRRAAWVAPG
jgi:hypothetical protein